MNGIELLYRIKENELKDKTIIAVYHKDKFIFNMIYIDNQIKWNKNTFRLSMLIDDDFNFEILGEVKEVLKAIELIIGEAPNIYDEVIQEIKDIIKELKE